MYKTKNSSHATGLLGTGVVVRITARLGQVRLGYHSAATSSVLAKAKHGI